MSTYTKEYNMFFTSPAGEYMLTAIRNMIDDAHGKAEDQPELARDHVQRAKGIREVQNHIASMTAESKQSPYSVGKSEQVTNTLPGGSLSPTGEGH